MLRTCIVAAGVACALIADGAAAQGETRADRIMAASALAESCAGSEESEVGRLNQAYCLGAITGIADAAMTLNIALRGHQTICLTESDDAESMRLAYLSFYRRNADVQVMPAATAVIAMLQRNYPCS